MAAPPDVGPAKNVLAVWVSKAGTSVPVVVIGDPETVELKITPSPVIATEVTVPVPAGRSAVTNDLKAGVAAEPVVGPAHTVFALSVAKVTASVPEEVTGLPATEKMFGIVNATEVTVPVPAGRSAATKALKAG